MLYGLLFLAAGGGLAWYLWPVFVSQWRKARNWNGARPDFTLLLYSFFFAVGGTFLAVLGLIFFLASI
jgi:hypothetical protein